MALVQDSSVFTFCVLQYNAVSLNDDMAQQNRHGAIMSNLVTNSGLVYIHKNDVFNFALTWD